MEAPPDPMAKRARGSSTRPGQRAPIQRTPARPPASTTAPATKGVDPIDDDDPLAHTAIGAYEGNSLTEADLARAAALEAQIVAEEKASEVARQPKSRTAAFPRATSTLAEAAAHEYDYVARDVRRITLIGGSLIALLIGRLRPSSRSPGPSPSSSRGRGALPSRHATPHDDPPGARPEALFQPPPERQPLAARMRPRSLAEFVGQEHLVGERGPLRRSIARGHLASTAAVGTAGHGQDQPRPTPRR